jgi:hypothetical protein
VRTTLLLLALTCPAWAQEGPRFVEVAAERGLPETSAFRCVWTDLDGDGWADAVLNHETFLRSVPDPKGGRRFVRLTGGLDPVRPDLTLYADLDEDGAQDALVAWSLDPSKPGYTDPGRRTSVRLLAHDPSSGAACVGSAVHPSAVLPPEMITAAAWLDADRDGRLDLVVAGNYREGGGPLEAYPVRLYRGLGGGAFEEVTDRAGLTLRVPAGQLDSRRPIFGLTTADIDGDGWMDILATAYGRQRNLLWLNQRDGTFQDVGMASGFAGDDDTSGVYSAETKRYFKERYGQEREDEPPFRSNGNTFDAAVGDVDGDGDWDVLLAMITHSWAGPSSDLSALLENITERQGVTPTRFRRHPEAVARPREGPNWNQGDLYCGMFDADNDGLLDLLMASGDYPDTNRLRLFRQTSPLVFEDVTDAAGITLDNTAQISLCDYDRDGDVDILTGRTNTRLPPDRQRPMRPYLYENRSPPRHWLQVRLRGLGAARGGSNREGIGATIVAELEGGRSVRRQLQGGHGHAGHNGLYEATLGLGDAAVVKRLTVRWPGPVDRTSVFEDVPADRGWLVVEEKDGEGSGAGGAATGRLVPLGPD